MDRAALAADAYVYGYPLVASLTEVGRFTREGMGAVPATPFNRFGHAHRLAGPDDTFVSINNDTIYSIAQVDVGGGPVRLAVPDTGGAYYVLQVIDAWTNNIAYVGRRASGTGAGTFLIVPRGYTGEVPDDTAVIPASTSVVTIVGRLACDGPADLPRVERLQNGLRLQAQATEDRTPLPPVAATGVPEDLLFFEHLRSWLAAFPPAVPDRAYQERFRPIGLLDADPPYADPPADLADALVEGAAQGRAKIEHASRGAPTVNGWQIAPHAFDYNVDFLGPGTRDSPQWKISDRLTGYLARAVAARVGLWGNHGYEAVYAPVYVDGDGATLSGAHAYELRFPGPPPVDAFWSLTMYDMPDYYLVPNPIDRYSIGDRTPGLRREPEGAFTLRVSHSRPADGDTSNWLPAPPGAFRPLMRLYQPRSEILHGGYALPPLIKVA
ncbi:DUF1254 domain-containing protein [Asanoa iriomotensis]|uniref:DUF1254 domain-containing protein n=1 Tax=Asanoa iriomotensis TaxID=234613 RepID=A0ABQ4CHK2_9ACTN|nr:DUF1254 domain-containing protein [Asanoa iriomotensis]GIF61946.1 hypothetical protein Air01nite_80410 [Asanoa iriomotensis]